MKVAFLRDSVTKLFVSGFFVKQLHLVPLNILRNNFDFITIIEESFDFKGTSVGFLSFGFIHQSTPFGPLFTLLNFCPILFRIRCVIQIRNLYCPQRTTKFTVVAYSAQKNSPQWPRARKDLGSQISRRIRIYICNCFRSRIRVVGHFQTKNLMLLSL